MFELAELRIVETSASEPPAWREVTPHTDLEYNAVGVATRAPNLESGVERARVHAIVQIIEQAYGIDASRDYTRERVEAQTEFGLYLRDQLTGASRGRLREMRSEWYWRRWNDGAFDVWVLFSVPKAVIARYIETERERREGSERPAATAQSACLVIRVPNPRPDISQHWYDSNHFSLSRLRGNYYFPDPPRVWEEVKAELCENHPDQSWCVAFVLDQWCGGAWNRWYDETRPECEAHRLCALKKYCISIRYPDQRCLELQIE